MAKTDLSKYVYDAKYLDDQELFHDDNPFIIDEAEVTRVTDVLSKGSKRVTREYALFILKTGHTGQLQIDYNALYNPGPSFNYAIGKPWKVGIPMGSVGFYSSSGETFYGTLKDANEFCSSLNRKDSNTENQYRVYKITELTQEDRDNLEE